MSDHHPDPDPIFQTHDERLRAILENRLGTFGFDSKNSYTGHVAYPNTWYSVDRIGRNAVIENRLNISNAATEFGVGQELIEAIVYLENAHGWYDIFHPTNKTIRPGNINAEIWADLLNVEPDLVHSDNTINIRLTAKILSEIQSRLVDPTPAAIASLYNGLSRDQIAGYGLTIEEYMKQRPWDTSHPAYKGPATFSGLQIGAALTYVESGRGTATITWTFSDESGEYAVTHTIAAVRETRDDGMVANQRTTIIGPDGEPLSASELREFGFSHLTENVLIKNGGFQDFDQCFIAGTMVTMADKSKKPIERVKIGDEVLAYDATNRKGQGNLTPRRVTRTYATPDKLVIDFHGLKVTPGHVFLCGDGEFAGQHRMLIEILRSDGTIVSADGTVLRAATNAPVESREDAFVQVAYLTDGNEALMQTGQMRAGTLILTPEGESKSVLACMEEDGYRFDSETGLIAKDGKEPHALYWCGEIPRPEDYVLKRSELTDADLYAEPGYQSEVAVSAAPSKLGQGVTPAEGTLHATATKQAGETIH